MYIYFFKRPRYRDTGFLMTSNSVVEKAGLGQGMPSIYNFLMSVDNILYFVKVTVQQDLRGVKITLIDRCPYLCSGFFQNHSC
jgi:hypothetical protein